MRLVLAVTTVVLCTVPAFAVDAITYRGTIGNREVVVELADPGNGDPVGRFSYLDHGADIPLNALEEVDGFIGLLEEAPCTETTCVADDNGVVFDKPVGAAWILAQDADGSLHGEWTPDGKGKTLAIDLAEVGRRTLADDVEVTPYGLYYSVQELTYSNGEQFTAAAAPYEFAKMDVALEEGPVLAWEGSSYRFVTDPRTKFAFPRVVALVDGSSPEAANTALARRHAEMNYFAFDCLSRVYGGFGGQATMLGLGAGTLADFEYESVEMAYLSPTVLGWTEGGSTFCQGAYPNNHFDSYVIDTRTGAPLAIGLVFKDWVAAHAYADYDADVDQAEALAHPDLYDWRAEKPLVDYVLAHRTPGDPVYEEECGIEELIPDYLGMRFGPGDEVIFSLVGLPHVIFACGDDLVTVRLAEIPELLAPGAEAYFPNLGN